MATGTKARPGAVGESGSAGDIWRPPGKDCGLCGARNCTEFGESLAARARAPGDCPFYRTPTSDPGPADGSAGGGPAGRMLGVNAVVPPLRGVPTRSHLHSARHLRDVLGHSWDFVLSPLPGEPSARKTVLPFRPDLVEKWGLTEGDIVLGRPAGAGCPVQHVLRVVKADPLTGVLETWVAGPALVRGRSIGGPDAEIKDVSAYHMLGFEGLATSVRRTPVFGARHTFLPGFCMMHLNHTGLVNLALGKVSGLHVRLEDIRILAGPPG